MPFPQQFLQGSAPGIIPGVASGESDPSLKSQVSGRVIEQRLARSLSVEAASFAPGVVRANRYARDRGCLAPQIGLLPIRGGARRFEKNHLSSEPARNPSEEPLQFAEARPGAGTMRMREHDQRWPVGIGRDLAALRPGDGSLSSTARSI